MDETTLMTAADHAALLTELEALEGDGRRAMAMRIKTAREWGDLKENSEYHDAKNDQAHLETKIVLLRERLARAKVVEAAAGDQGSSPSARPCSCATRTGASSASRSSAHRPPRRRRGGSRSSRRSPAG